MRKASLLICGLAGAITGTLTHAADDAWEASAAPVAQENGQAYCHMTRRDGARVLSIIAHPGKQFIGVFAPRLKGKDVDLEADLRFAGGNSYTLNWLGANGSYTAQLSPTGLSTVLDAIWLWDEAMSIVAAPDISVRFPLDGAADAARRMKDCRKQMAEE